ncbi:MAG: hypothetical protein FJW30_20595 [Acidobacteria bacterium]|nr:hypothetical protein [Acidobacteriota bacterium]
MTLLLGAIVWSALEPGTRALLEPAGISEANFETWVQAHRQTTAERLREGTAEHIGYFVMQSRRLHSSEPLTPLTEARAFHGRLSARDQKRFLDGHAVEGAFSEPLELRLEAFLGGKLVDERHRLLRDMAERLGWPAKHAVQAALRFPLLRATASEPAEVEDLYQQRGLSGDPYPPSMKAVEAGVALLDASPKTVLLAGPGIELGSRFGVDDSKPVVSPQPEALHRLVRPRVFDCVDIREEVTKSLQKSPCRALTADIAVDRPGTGTYALIVATNVLAYLTEIELAVAFSNLKQALEPGGCLLHNDARFAVRVAGEAAGLPVKTLQAVPLGAVNGREQVDRAVLHCRAR